MLGAQEGKRVQGSQFQATFAMPIYRINPQFGFQACDTHDAIECISYLALQGKEGMKGKDTLRRRGVVCLTEVTGLSNQ